MGIPSFLFWQQILEHFPEAQVVLLVRNEDEWCSPPPPAKRRVAREQKHALTWAPELAPRSSETG